jgi:hypothetical protein
VYNNNASEGLSKFSPQERAPSAAEKEGVHWEGVDYVCGVTGALLSAWRQAEGSLVLRLAAGYRPKFYPRGETFR